MPLGHLAPLSEGRADTLVEGTTRSTQRERARPPPSKQRMSTWGPTTFCHGKSLRHNGKVRCVRRRVYRVGVMESATYHLKTVMMASSRIEGPWCHFASEATFQHINSSVHFRGSRHRTLFKSHRMLPEALGLATLMGFLKKPDEKPSQSRSWNLRMTVTLAERQGGAQYLKCRMSRGR